MHNSFEGNAIKLSSFFSRRDAKTQSLEPIFFVASRLCESNIKKNTQEILNSMIIRVRDGSGALFINDFFWQL